MNKTINLDNCSVIFDNNKLTIIFKNSDIASNPKLNNLYFVNNEQKNLIMKILNGNEKLIIERKNMMYSNSYKINGDMSFQLKINGTDC
jgi:hypothetical protein